MKENDNPVTLVNLKAAKADLERRITKLINTFEEDYGVTVDCSITRDCNKNCSNTNVNTIILIY